MNRIILQRKYLQLSVFNIIFLFGILLLLNSCASDSTDELREKINGALKNDNVIDESEWNSFTKYIVQNKQSFAVFINENNTINKNELESFIISVASKRRNRNKGKVKIFGADEVEEEVVLKEIKINFYFENSGSMNGYLYGTDFNKNMHRIIDKDLPNFTPYFVNTKEYKTSDLLEKIDNKNIKTAGTNSSDHEFIFTNAIENAIDNNLSVVVTDGIYSTTDGNVDIVEVDIEKAFVRALKKNAIETVVLKLSSEYKGTYYTESDCDNEKIDQERPYYILLFGNQETINNALKNIVIIDELDGFEEFARFFLTDNIKVDYTILTQGEEKKGSFRKIGRGGKGLVKEIEDAERTDRGGEKYLQFAIGVDYSGTSISKPYLSEKENYRIDGDTGYIIEEIKEVKNISKASTTYKTIQKINTSEGISLSHLITVKAALNVTGELKIKLENNLPSWIKETGIDSDCDIQTKNGKTFAFDNLMIGVSRAYSKVNENDEYIELTLNIKH